MPCARLLKKGGEAQAGLTKITVGARDNGTNSKQPIIFEQILTARFTNSNIKCHILIDLLFPTEYSVGVGRNRVLSMK